MFHSSDDEQDLRRRACAAIHAKVLPRDRHKRSWGGRGSGELCPVCGQSIESTEPEVELEFATADSGNEVRVLHLHLPCFAAWEIARTFAARDSR